MFPWNLYFLSALFAAPLPQVPDGFSIELAAGEEQAVYPMFAAFDDHGRLFVAESSGLDLYAELSALTRRCRVRCLEDRDGDGRFERSRVLIDKLVFPMGLAWRDGRLYIADPPEVVAYDIDPATLEAGERRSILGRFGHSDNGSLHGLIFGPDGWLYLTMGSPDGYRIERSNGSFLEGQSGALIRCRPDGSRPEVICRGFENLVEIAFLPDGGILGTDNWFQLPAEGKRDALLHLIEGGLYPRHPDRGTPYPVTGPPLPAMSLFPAVALSGLLCYRGQAFPEEMHGNLFSAQHNSRKVGKHVVSPHGSTYRSQDFDFVTSADPDFHPADVIEAADGSLLVIDTGGWYVQHCPTGRIRDSRAPGGIYRVRCRKAPAVEDPWGAAIGWGPLRPEALCRHLGDARPWVSDRAARRLIAHSAGALPAIRELLQSPAASRSAREAALWAAGGIDGEEASALILEPLKKGDGELARLAARLAGLRRLRPAAADLAGLLRRPDARIQLAAAEALSRCGDAAAVPQLLSVLESPIDRHLEHAVVHALYQLAGVTDFERALASAFPRIQKAALILLDQRSRQQLTAPLVLGFLGSSDAELQRAAFEIFAKREEWSAAAEAPLRAWLEKADLAPGEESGLRLLARAFGAAPALAPRLAPLVAGSEGRATARNRVLALEALADNPPTVLPLEWIEALRRSLAAPEESLRLGAARACRALPAAELSETLARLAEDAEQPLLVRLEALQAALPHRQHVSEAAFQLLLEQLSADQKPLSRLAAVSILAPARLSEAQLRRLLKTIGGDGLITPAMIAPLLERSAGAATLAELTEYLDRSISRGWRPAEAELRRVFAPFGAAGVEKARPLLERLKAGVESQAERLREFAPLLSGGDAERGREVFSGGKAACSTCHRLGQEGGQVGPDLTRIGAIRSGRDLLESVLFPSATFAPGYENYVIVLASGRILNGLMVQKSPERIVLRDAKGADLPLSRNQIADLQRQSTSIMPEGLDRTMSRDELRDLLAYLQSQN